MDILYLLIPTSVVLMLAVLGVFAWAVQAGQFEAADGLSLEAEGRRILDADRLPLDGDQSALVRPAEQS